MAICSLQFGIGLMFGIVGTLLIQKIRQEYREEEAKHRFKMLNVRNRGETR